ncbi:hypothetical protein pb186bvf_004260 [Paramecium bursaria]
MSTMINQNCSPIHQRSGSLYLEYQTIELRQMDILKRRDLLHGQFTFWSALYAVYKRPSDQKNSYEIQLTMLISSGYFLYDVLVCIYNDLYDYWLVFHHIVSLVAFAQSLITRQNGVFIIYGILITEISNLPMHLRYLIGQFGFRFTKIYETMELIYFLLFILFRGVLAPIYIYHIWKDIQVSFVIKLMASGLLFYSIYYFYEMGKIMKRKYRGYKERTKKKIDFYWFSINPDIAKLQYREIIDPIL